MPNRICSINQGRGRCIIWILAVCALGGGEAIAGKKSTDALIEQCEAAGGTPSIRWSSDPDLNRVECCWETICAACYHDGECGLYCLTPECCTLLGGRCSISMEDPAEEDTTAGSGRSNVTMDYTAIPILDEEAELPDTPAVADVELALSITPGAPVIDHPDCNANGIDDALDMAEGNGQDCNQNQVLDACEADDDLDGVTDDCDRCPGHDDGVDLDEDGTPDCELTTPGACGGVGGAPMIVGLIGLCFARTRRRVLR